MLTIRDVDVFYGAIQALNNVTIDVRQGEVVAIIGSNGAGKSTLLRTISGLLRPRNGTICFECADSSGQTVKEDIHSMPADQIVRRGISHSPEGRRIFTNMSVMENLQLGAFIRKDGEIAADMDAV